MVFRYHRLVDKDGRIVQMPATALLHLLCEVCGWQAYVPRVHATRTVWCPHCRAKTLHWSAGLDMLVIPLLPHETLKDIRSRPPPASSPSVSTEYNGQTGVDELDDVFAAFVGDDYGHAGEED